MTLIQLDFTDGLCGAGNCSAGCGGGYIDGVFNTMLCLKDTPCAGNCGCDCRFPYITTTLPSVEFSPGDEIIVILLPPPGSLPEFDESDDFKALVVPEKPIFWNNLLTSVDITPSRQPGKFDLEVSGASVWRLADTDVDMSMEAQVFVEGTLQASAVVQGFASPPGPGQSGCDGSPSICDNGCGSWNFDPVQCELWFTYPTYSLGCECGTPWILPFAAIPAQPGDEIVVVLVPAPNGLPTLPGSEGDDSLVIPVPSGCIGDINGDGIVNGADVGLLLGDWGGPGPGDLDENGTTDGGDLGLLLGDWGPCAQVQPTALALDAARGPLRSAGT
jgi:hypothetical protein